MNDCSTCGLPIVWSIDRARPWCSVYGDHPAAPAAYDGPNVVTIAHPIAAVIKLDRDVDRSKYKGRVSA